MRETAVERRLSMLVQRAGGKSVKIMPVVAGTPDRLIILPPGRMYLIETKAPNGVLRPAQRVWHARALEMGVVVELLWNTKQVDEWVLTHCGPLSST
jgi:hypothetical protein